MLNVEPLDNLIIQTSHQRSAPYTNLYTRTKRCYWLDSKIFSQPQFRNLSTPIKELIECIQIQTGNLVLILVYIFNCLMLNQRNWIKEIHFFISIHVSVYIYRLFVVKALLIPKCKKMSYTQHRTSCFTILTNISL